MHVHSTQWPSRLTNPAIDQLGTLSLTGTLKVAANFFCNSCKSLAARPFALSKSHLKRGARKGKQRIATSIRTVQNLLRGSPEQVTCAWFTYAHPNFWTSTLLFVASTSWSHMPWSATASLVYGYLWLVHGLLWPLVSSIQAELDHFWNNSPLSADGVQSHYIRRLYAMRSSHSAKQIGLLLKANLNRKVSQVT